MSTGLSGVLSTLSLRLHLGDPSAVAEVRAALASHGSRSAAAEALGVTYRTLCRWSEPGGLLEAAGLHDSRVIEKPAGKSVHAQKHDNPVIAKRRKRHGSRKSATGLSRVGGSDYENSHT